MPGWKAWLSIFPSLHCCPRITILYLSPAPVSTVVFAFSTVMGAAVGSLRLGSLAAVVLALLVVLVFMPALLVATPFMASPLFLRGQGFPLRCYTINVVG
uniref:Uncharacterized protein n=1 Tax=Dunaliella tertiolecta TaxID=3047 RepID=A0A7S3QY96_DUNTE